MALGVALRFRTGQREGWWGMAASGFCSPHVSQGCLGIIKTGIRKWGFLGSGSQIEQHISITWGGKADVQGPPADIPVLCRAEWDQELWP